jgi:aldehyde:ferredoxin oxidoreductase
MDTISVGASIAFAMEAFEKGIITSEATGGVPSRKRLTCRGLTDFDALGNSTA